MRTFNESVILCIVFLYCLLCVVNGCVRCPLHIARNKVYIGKLRYRNLARLAEDAFVGDDHDDEGYEDSETDHSDCVRVRSSPLDRTDRLVANVLIARPAKHRRQREQR